MTESESISQPKENGAARVEAIREDLACPDCGYNLRGLTGDVVFCPECARPSDVAALVAARWTGRWYKAPGFNALLLPTAVVVIGGLVCLMITAYAAMQDSVSSSSIRLWVVLGPAGLFWVWRMSKTLRAFAHPMQGPALALLAHVLFVGYFGGLVGFISGLISTIFGFVNSQFYEVVVGLIFVGVAAVVILGCLWGERFIARCCIREYLRRQSSTERIS